MEHTVEEREPLHLAKILGPYEIREHRMFCFRLLFSNQMVMNICITIVTASPWLPAVPLLYAILLRHGKRGKLICAVRRRDDSTHPVGDYEFWHGRRPISQAGLLRYLHLSEEKLRSCWHKRAYPYIVPHVLETLQLVIGQLARGNMLERKIGG